MQLIAFQRDLSKNRNCKTFVTTGKVSYEVTIRIKKNVANSLTVHFVLLSADTVSKFGSWELFFKGRNRVLVICARIEENKFIIRISAAFIKPGTFIIYKFVTEFKSAHINVGNSSWTAHPMLEWCIHATNC